MAGGFVPEGAVKVVAGGCCSTGGLGGTCATGGLFGVIGSDLT